MTRRSMRKRRTPLRIGSIDDYVYDDDDAEGEEEEEAVDESESSSREKGMQIVCYSQLQQQPFTLPDDWLVEQRPRPSNPTHVDKYYYEPHTGRKFRSLLSVQRYLTNATTEFRTTERMISGNENTTYIEPGTGQRFRPFRSVEKYVSGENACTTTPKSVVKSGTGNHWLTWARSVRKRSSITREDRVTQEPLKQHSVQPMHPNKSDSPKKINSGKDNTALRHNLPRPPEKVTWVLSGPGGCWNPFVDDSIVPESEKLKWSEAFVLSIHNGVI